MIESPRRKQDGRGRARTEPAAMRFEINRIRVYRGCVAGFGEPTAVVGIRSKGMKGSSPARLDRLARGVPALGVDDAAWGEPLQWPSSFLHQPTARPRQADCVVALAVALARSAGDAVWKGRVLNAANGAMTLALPYRRTAVLRTALIFALRYVALWSSPTVPVGEARKLTAEVRAWREAARRAGLSPLTLRFYAAARRRDLPVSLEAGVLRLGWGMQAERLDASFTGRTSNVATRFARGKVLARRVLAAAGVPLARAACVGKADQARAAAKTLGWPVVVKPSNLDRGIGVVPGIRDEEVLCRAFEKAAEHSPGAVLIEEHVEGDDHRLLVVDGQVLAAARRLPGGVVGDGSSTVEQLLERLNGDWRRGDARSLLVRIELDEEALRCLAEQGLSRESIPAADTFVRLRYTANISAGGTAQDVSADLHPDNRALAIRAARAVGLDIAGVDFICRDISKSWREAGGIVCEVNAQPGFRPHWLAEPDRDLHGEIIAWLFRDKPGRIPTTAITGTNGKTTVARMLHHIWLESGVVAGVCTTHGVWVGRELVTQENLSGQPGGQLLLNDSTVGAAVIEMPRKALMLFGHPCDRYQVAALLNVQDDHIGVGGIQSLEAMAQFKAQVLTRATDAVVVNADDPLCMAMRGRVAVETILVARDRDNAAVRDHVGRGGRAVFLAEAQGRRCIALAEGAAQWMIVPIEDIPATMNGLLRFNETNALFAAALACAHRIPVDAIRRALLSFCNAPEHNVGRYNFIDDLPFRVLLDFGHNPAGIDELLGIVSRLDVRGQKILACVVGNRHRRHLEEVAPKFATAFDRVYLAQDETYFSRNCEGYSDDDPLGDLLSAAQSLMWPLLKDGDALQLRRSRPEALREALGACREGDLLVLLAEPWEALAEIDVYRAELREGL